MGPLLCQDFFEVIFRNHFILSFSIAFVSYLVQFSLHPLLNFYGVPICFNGMSVGLLWDLYGISLVFLWDPYDM